MALAFSDALREHILDSFGNAAAGETFDSGTLKLRTGAAPGPNAAGTGTVVATITLPADAFAAAASNAMAKAGTWEDTSADASGIMAHFRILQSGDADGATGATDERIEGTVTEGGGGGDIDFDNNDVNSGQTVTISTFTLNN